MFDYGQYRQSERASLNASPSKNSSMIGYDRDIIYSSVSAVVVKSK